jgi:hypothetical protein
MRDVQGRCQRTAGAGTCQVRLPSPEWPSKLGGLGSAIGGLAQALLEEPLAAELRRRGHLSTSLVKARNINLARLTLAPLAQGCWRARQRPSSLLFAMRIPFHWVKSCLMG